MNQFIAYILESTKTGKFYIGSTNDLARRMARHNRGDSRWTRTGIPWVVVYQKIYSSRQEAVRYERFLKNMKNKQFLKQIIVKNTAG